MKTLLNVSCICDTEHCSELYSLEFLAKFESWYPIQLIYSPVQFLQNGASSSAGSSTQSRKSPSRDNGTHPRKSPSYENRRTPPYENRRSPQYENTNSPSYELRQSPSYENKKSPINENKNNIPDKKHSPSPGQRKSPPGEPRTSSSNALPGCSNSNRSSNNNQRKENAEKPTSPGSIAGASADWSLALGYDLGKTV